MFRVLELNVRAFELRRMPNIAHIVEIIIHSDVAISVSANSMRTTDD